MKLYRGARRRCGTTYVTVTEPGGKPRPLALRYGDKPDQVKHSPLGFDWGYSGAMPAQLAFALCYDVLETPELARLVYQGFKAEVLARLDSEQDWSISEAEIRLKLNALMAPHRRPAEAS